VDPTKTVHNQLGLAYGLRAIPCSKICIGTLRAFWQAVTRCWCICSAGDVSQQGAAFVFKPPNEMVFKHLETNPIDHADADEFFGAANLN